MAAAGDEPDGSLDEQEPENPDAAPLLAEEAVQLPEQIRAQLSDLGIDADLQLFLQQKALKAQARQQKAEKTLQSAAKAQARAEAKAAKEQAKQQDEEPKALPKRKAKAKSANKRKAEEPAASAGDSEAAAAEPKKAKLAATRLNTLTPHLVPSRYSWASIAEGTIESIMAELEPVFKLGLVSYIMAPPETASDGSKIQVIAHKNHFYVLKTSVSPLAVRVCEHFDLQVNEKKGTNVNWNRQGFEFGFKIAKIIAGGFQKFTNISGIGSKLAIMLRPLPTHSLSTYDKVNDPICQDLTTLAGFLGLIKRALRLEPGGLLWLANPCHMHVWMSSSVHQRGPERPWGDVNKDSVRRSNCITSRACLILYLITCRGVWSAIEQPVSSTLKFVPYFLHLRTLLLACNGEMWKYCSFWMGLYGHDNAKPSYCIGSSRWIMKLKNRMTRESRSKYQAAAKKVVVRKKRSDGTTAVWGAYTHIEYLSGLGQSVYQLRTGTKHLTATQAYPEGFAKADSPGNWTEAELDELQEFLVSEASKGSWKPLEGVPL
ncbi:unnamed protein product [Symbiodinium microadriaticum]|nr:unnamed protein product [Symbiodinium microadriaticum]